MRRTLSQAAEDLAIAETTAIRWGIRSIRASIFIGEVARNLPKAIHGGPGGGTRPRPGTILRRDAIAAAGLTPKIVRECERLVDVDPELVARYVARCVVRGEPPTRGGLLRALKVGALAHAGEAETDFYTPAEYVEAARRVMGGIDLDPASSSEANKVVKAARIFTRDDDGLSREWDGRVWLNPPYGVVGRASSAGVWAANLVTEYEAGRVSAAVLLVDAQTGKAWFRPLLSRAICFAHRVRFLSPSGRPHTSQYGSAFVYFGPDEEGFAAEFSQWGTVTG